MIERVQELIVDDPSREVWKRLRYLLDPTSASEIIRRYHGLETNQFQTDVKKQARQIGYSILQAEEYFSASDRVSLTTRPVLLYYGAVSLSKALILTTLDGSHSYDALRKSNRHQHHGLDLSRLFLSIPVATASIQEFLGAIVCGLHVNQSGEPWGHFPLFFQSPSPPVFQFKKEIHDDIRRSSTLWSLEIMDGPPNQSLEDLCKEELSLLKLVCGLPDMYFFLRDLNITPVVARGDMTMKQQVFHTLYPDGSLISSQIHQTWDYFIDGINPPKKVEFVVLLQGLNPDLKIIDDFGSNMHMRMILKWAANEEAPRKYFPDLVQDAHGRFYYVLEPKTHIDDLASYFVILYSLGMIARYYPDVWVKSTQENVRLAEFIDTLLSLISLRLPNLMLDQIYGIKHFIH